MTFFPPFPIQLVSSAAAVDAVNRLRRLVGDGGRQCDGGASFSCLTSSFTVLAWRLHARCGDAVVSESWHGKG